MDPKAALKEDPETQDPETTSDVPPEKKKKNVNKKKQGGHEHKLRIVRVAGSKKDRYTVFAQSGELMTRIKMAVKAKAIQSQWDEGTKEILIKIRHARKTEDLQEVVKQIVGESFKPSEASQK